MSVFTEQKKSIEKLWYTCLIKIYIKSMANIFCLSIIFFYLVLNYSNILNEKKLNKRKTWTLHQYFAGYENWNITIPYSNYDERGNQ